MTTDKVEKTPVAESTVESKVESTPAAQVEAVGMAIVANGTPAEGTGTTASTGETPAPAKKVKKKLSQRLANISDEEIAAAASQRSKLQFRIALKRKVRLFYDLQRMRIQAGGRTAKHASGAEIELHPTDVKILGNRASELLAAEKNALKDVEDQLKLMDIYTKVLCDKKRFKGIGPTMAGVILAEFAIEREDTPSKMWAFAGLAPVAAMRCRHCQRVVVVDDDATAERDDGETVYKHAQKSPECVHSEDGSPILSDSVFESAKSMRPTKGEKLPYNNFLRSKLCGVLGPVMLKVGSPWRKSYDDYKKRKLSQNWGVNDAHRHQAAIRYMIKMLLLEIWREWRTLEGLPVRDPYAVEKLGKTPHVGGTLQNNRAPSDPKPKENTLIDAEIEAALAEVQ